MLKNESEYYSLKLAFEIELKHIQKLNESNHILAEELKTVDDQDLKDAITENEEAIIVKMEKIELIRDALKDCGIVDLPSIDEYNLKAVDKNTSDTKEGPLMMTGGDTSHNTEGPIITEPLLIMENEESSPDSELYEDYTSWEEDLEEEQSV